MNIASGNEQIRQWPSHIRDVPESIRERLRELSALNPLLSSYRITLEWILISASIYFCQRHWNLVFYALAVVLIGARQHALLILMHDGAHYRLFSNRRINDCIGEVFLAWPCFITLRSYRRIHMNHHRYMNTDRDPDWSRKIRQPGWTFPKSRRELARILFADVTALNTLSLLRHARSLAEADKSVSRTFVVLRVGFYLLTAIMMIWTGTVKAFLFYWVIPYLTWLALVLHIRSIAEHFAIPTEDNLHIGIRTTYTNILGRMLVAPHNVSYHVEHHLVPSVPFYRLPELHKVLRSTGLPESAGHLTNGYFDVFRECTRRVS